MTENEKLQRIINGLKCSAEEAKTILEYDKRIDKGYSTEYDLDKEREKVAKKMRQTGTKTVAKPCTFKPKATRKGNAAKGAIISALVDYLLGQEIFDVCDLQVLNAERLIAFDSDGETYTITLTKKKKG